MTIIKDLQSRPQIAKRVSDLLAIDVSQLLRMTQYHTIPFLILTKRRDILQRIADISEQKSIKAICMEPVQLAAILSSLLLQYSTNVESMISLALIEVSTEFKDFDLIEAANSNPMLIAFELLKAAGEMEEGKVGRVSSFVACHQDTDHSGTSIDSVSGWAHSAPGRIFQRLQQEGGHGRALLPVLRPRHHGFAFRDHQ